MIDIQAYIKSEVQLHIACQMLSLTGINLVAKEADDSHTTAVWNSVKGIIVGREFELNKNNFQVFVDPLEFAIGFIKNGEETDRFPLDGLSYMQTVEPWKKWLIDAGFSGELDLKLHYELPDNNLYKFEAFSKPSDEFLNEWAKNRTLANNALTLLTKMVGTPSDINIWSHHFDTGTYYELHKTGGVTDRSIGAGFGVADTMVSEPYFYIYGWHKDKKLDYSDAPKLKNGKWITENWEGAVLPISELGDNPENTVLEFYKTASNYLKLKLT